MLLRMVLSTMRGGTGSGRIGARVDRGYNIGHTARIRNLKDLIYIKTNINHFKDFQLETFKIRCYIET